MVSGVLKDEMMETVQSKRKKKIKRRPNVNFNEEKTVFNYSF